MEVCYGEVTSDEENTREDIDRRETYHVTGKVIVNEGVLESVAVCHVVVCTCEMIDRDRERVQVAA